MNDVMSEDIGSESAGPDGPPPPPPPPPPGDAPGEPGGGSWDPSELLGGLHRSDSDRWIAGVAGGIARQWSVETWVVRLGLFVLTFTGIGVPLYILAWLLLPSDMTPSLAQQRGWNRNTIIGITIVVAVAGASMAIVGESGPVWLLPWCLIALGVWFLVRDRHDPSPVPAAWSATGAQPSTATPQQPGSTSPPYTAAPTPEPTQPHFTAASTPAPPTSPQPPRQKRRSFLTPLAIFGLITYAGIALAVDDGRWSEPGVVASIALITIGGVLLVSTWLGRARGLIVFGIIVVFPVLVSLGSGDTWRDWDPDQVIRPSSTAELDATYEWGFGHRVLDLSDVDLAPGSDIRVQVDQIAGELEIVLPEDTTTTVSGEVAAGNVRIVWPESGPADVQVDGFGADLSRRVVTGDGRARLRLEADLGAGDMVIRAEQPERTRTDEEGPR